MTTHTSSRGPVKRLRANPRPLSLVLLITIVGGCAIVLTAMARSHLVRTEVVTVSAASRVASDKPSEPLRPAAAATDRIEVEEVVVTPTGFDPQKIDRPAGRFILVISNRLIAKDCEFRLQREAGPKLHDVSLKRGEHDWNDSFDLTPGRYVLTEANHPDWICRINIR